MSVNFKYSCILALGGIGALFNSSEAAKPTNAVDLYSERLNMELYAAEVPGSLPEDITVYDYVADPMEESADAQAEVKPAKTEKKVSAKAGKSKNSSKN
jgi:hypothetical protein